MRDSVGAFFAWFSRGRALRRGWCVWLALVLMVAVACGAVGGTDVVFPKNWPLPGLTLPAKSRRAPLLERTGRDNYVIKGVVVKPGQIRFGVGFSCGYGWGGVSTHLHDQLTNMGFTQRRGAGSIHYYSSADRTMDVRVIASEQFSNRFTLIVDCYDKPQVWMQQG